MADYLLDRSNLRRHYHLTDEGIALLGEPCFVKRWRKRGRPMRKFFWWRSRVEAFVEKYTAPQPTRRRLWWLDD